MLGCGMVWNGLFWYCTAVEFRQCVFRLVRSSWIAVAHGSHVELVLVGVSWRKAALGTDWQSWCCPLMSVRAWKGQLQFVSQVLFSR